MIFMPKIVIKNKARPTNDAFFNIVCGVGALQTNNEPYDPQI